jgi:hypothetical protein
MYENRISELFQIAGISNQSMGVTNIRPIAPGAAVAAQLLPIVSVQDIYQMAAAKAQYDYELDKLFNPEYYGDHGSGI